MTQATESLESEATSEETVVEDIGEVESVRPRALRSRRLPYTFLGFGLLLLGAALVLTFLPKEPTLADRLARAGVGPSTLLLFGAGLIALAFLVLDSRRAEDRLGEDVESAAVNLAPAAGAPPEVVERLESIARAVQSLRPSQEVVERLEALGRGIESLRSSLAQVDIVARKVTDGVEATYRSAESLKERLGRLKTEAGFVGPDDLAKVRAAIEQALGGVRTQVEGLAKNSGKSEELPRLRERIEALSRAVVEERDASRAVAGEMERLVTLVAEQMGAISESVAAIARTSGDTRELKAGIDRILSAVRDLPPTAAPQAPMPPAQTFPPAAPPFGRDPVPSWEGRKNEAYYPPPAPAAPDHGRAPAAPVPPPAPATGGHGILDAIHRLKSIRKPPPG
ncbi:MAG: hypothetical protein L0323_01185 [Planctomycetes bacterium]|nr:hypothetical protein [Planctomycetota bacterium]